MPTVWRETVGRALRPVLESTALDRVRFVAPVRRFARDWAIAFGFWDDGVLEGEATLGPMSAQEAAARSRSRLQTKLTLYVDASEGATVKIRTFLGEVGASFSEVDISSDAASRKWLAEEYDGARPPQLFADGKRLGGLEEVTRLHAEGKLRPMLFLGDA